MGRRLAHGHPIRKFPATISSLSLALTLVAWPALAQLPASGALSEADRPLFRAEIARIEKSLPSAPDKSTVTYEMARTFAFAKQWTETIQWLRRAAELKVGLDPSREAVFAELRGTREFEEILAAVREATPAVSHSAPAFRIAEGDLAPESIAYDPNGRRFYLGSLRKGKVVRCPGAARHEEAAGDCAPFVSGLGTVVGLKVHGNGLWVLNNSDQESALIHYDLASAEVIRIYAVAGPGHSFNDLAFAPAGDLYLTDTRAGAVWHLANGAADLTKLPGRFEFANGITVSADGSLLYVSTFPDGISVVDLKTQTAAPVAHPGDLCLATIDGLYFYRGALIAIQNAFMTPRVVRLVLSRDLRAIERFEVLERRNPLFDGITTGVIAGGDFFYMANVQDDKKAGFNPISVLKLHL